MLETAEMLKSVPFGLLKGSHGLMNIQHYQRVKHFCSFEHIVFNILQGELTCLGFLQFRGFFG